MPDDHQNMNTIVEVDFHKVHIDMLKTMVPMFGDDTGEVVRYIVIDWLSKNIR